MKTDNASESSMQKVALTALAGTSIEWYDFFLYGAAAALIFPTAFFGEATPSTALILSLLTFSADSIAIMTKNNSPYRSRNKASCKSK